MWAPTSAAERGYRLAVNILAAGASVALLYYGRVFFITVIFAFIIALLLEPMVRLFMRVRVPRGMASFLVCSLAALVVYFAALAVYTQTGAIVDDLPAYGERINEIVDNAATRVETLERNIVSTLVPRRLREQVPVGGLAGQSAGDGVSQPGASSAGGPQPDPVLPNPVQEVRVLPEPTNLASYLYQYLASFYDILLMASFVPFLVYFILSWGDHLRSRVLVTLEGEPRYTVMSAMDGVADMVRAYVVGNFLLGILLSIASMLIFAAVQVPYWPLIGPVSGFLSLVPYIGLPLAMGPPIFALLPFSREPAVYVFLAISITVLHLLAVNLLYPKFVGSRVHLNPLVVTIALMLWGMLWGGVGLLLAIPITAAMKAVCDNVEGLEPYGRLLGD